MNSRYSLAALYGRMLREARPYWRHLAVLCLLSLLSTPLALLTPVPLKIAVDSVIGSRPLPGVIEAVLPAAATRSDIAVLALIASLLVAIGLLTQLQGLACSLLRTYAGEKLLVAFRARLFRHVQRLSVSNHDRAGTFDPGYRIQYDAPAIQRMLIDGIIGFATAGVTVSGMIVVMATMNWRLAMVAVAISPALVLLSRAYGRRLRDQWHEVSERQQAAISVVHEVLAAIRVVKSFGQEDREQARFVRRSGEGLWARIRVDLTEGGLGLAVGSTIAVAMAAGLFIGTREVRAGTLTLGELLIVMAYLGQIFGPLETLSRMTVHLQPALASAERAFGLLDEAPDVAERANARPIAQARGAVAFRSVSFAYPGDRPVLYGVSFTVPPGIRVGIAGATGSGKTTLLSLLTRFYDPTAGQILLDGVDLRDYRLADLRNQFAIHLQETVLFSASIFENIAYARPGASHQDVVAAATAAHAHEFIVGLSEGYQTCVGERGIRLSGGERQRISLARAFLKDAPVLILDEPTSFLDPQTDEAVVDAMRHLVDGRTTFIVAHRPSTLRNCDALLVVEGGRVLSTEAVARGDAIRFGPSAGPRAIRAAARGSSSSPRA